MADRRASAAAQLPSVDLGGTQLRVHRSDVIEPGLGTPQHLFGIVHLHADHFGDRADEVDAVARVEVVILARRVAPAEDLAPNVVIFGIVHRHGEMAVGGADVFVLLGHHDVLDRPGEHGWPSALGGKAVILLHRGAITKHKKPLAPDMAHIKRSNSQFHEWAVVIFVVKLRVGAHIRFIKPAAPPGDASRKYKVTISNC